MKNSIYRETWAEIDLGAIEINIRTIGDLCAKNNMGVMAVVKANGYGHGAVEVARTALRSGVNHLVVAMLDEAVELRDAGITAPILVLGRTRPEDAAMILKLKVIVSVYKLDWLIEAKKYLNEDQCIKIHLKLDTGMGRLGIRYKDEANAICDLILADKMFILDGVYTHYATADECDLSYVSKQHTRFLEMLSWIKEWGIEVPIIHNGNSAFGLRFPDKVHHLFRLGISMYGLTPSPEITNELPIPLKPALALKSRLIQVKRLPTGESIGYGATYQTKEDEWIGTLPIGYADGWLRYHGTTGGEVLVNGERAPFIGRICMDQCMIKLKGPVEEGTIVTLIGPDGNDEITMDEIAHRLNTINYEIPCILNQRIPRVYIR